MKCPLVHELVLQIAAFERSVQCSKLKSKLTESTTSALLIFVDLLCDYKTLFTLQMKIRRKIRWTICRITNSVETRDTSWNNNEYISTDNILMEMGAAKLSTADE